MAVFLQTYGENRNSGFDLDTYGDLCVLTKTTHNVSHYSFSMNCSGAESCVVQLWGEFEVPGPNVIKVKDNDSDPIPVCQNVFEWEHPPLPLALGDPRRVSSRKQAKARQNKPTTLSLCDPPPPPPRQRGGLPVNSDEHPVRRGPRIFNYRDKGSRIRDFRDVVVTHATPLWDNFLANLSVATDDDNGREFIDFIHRHCFKGDSLWKNLNGDWVDHEIPLGLKMETLFEIAWERRGLALVRLSQYWDVSIADETYELTNEEMKDLFQLQLSARRMMTVCAMGGGTSHKAGVLLYCQLNLEFEMTKVKPGEIVMLNPER